MYDSMTIIRDIFLCLVSLLLMYLCQCLIRALESESSRACSHRTERPVDPIMSPLTDEKNKSNAPTYKALYENEVEINHRVLQEMVILQHKLDEQEVNMVLSHRRPNIDGPKQSPKQNTSEVLPQKFPTEFYTHKGFNELSLQSTADIKTEARYNSGIYLKRSSAPLSPQSSNQSWESRSSLDAKTLASISDSPDSCASYGEIFRMSDPKVYKPEQSAPEVTNPASRQTISSPQISLSPFRGILPSQRKKAGKAASPPPIPRIPDTGSTSKSSNKQIQQGFNELKQEKGLVTMNLFRQPTRQLSHSAEKLLEEIVVGRAKLKPRTKEC